MLEDQAFVLIDVARCFLNVVFHLECKDGSRKIASGQILLS
jgi:hypothetical protein